MTDPASPPLTLAEIAELRRLHEEATPAPWRRAMDDGDQEALLGNKEHALVCIVSKGLGRPHGEANVALISSVREALPRLLLATERAEGLARAAEAYLELYEPQNAKRFWDEAGVKRSEVVAALAAYRGSAGGAKP